MHLDGCKVGGRIGPVEGVGAVEAQHALLLGLPAHLPGARPLRHQPAAGEM